MKRLLLLTQELIPSAILCGHAPLTRLAEDGRIEYRWRRPNEVRAADLLWAEVLVFVRSDDVMSRAIAGMARRAGRYTIYVMDDDLLRVPEGLSSSEHYRREETKALIRGVMAECRCFLSPSRELLARYGGAFDRAARIEEPALGRPSAPRAPDGELRIGFAGSVDRTGDIDALLSGALRRILKAYPGRVTAEFFGARPAVADELGLRHIPYCDSYEEYTRVMGTLGWDFALAPMPDTEFHRCKHYNKYVEYAAFGIPGIFSDVEPYRFAVRDGENGLLCANTEEAWTAAMERLIEDDALRARLASEAAREAATLYAPDRVAETWAGILDEAGAAPVSTRELERFNVLRPWIRLRHILGKIRQYKWQAPYRAVRALVRLLRRRRGQT